MVESSDRGRIAELIARSIQERRPFRFEHRAVRPDGTELVLHHEADVVEVGPAGEIGLEAVVIDVTEIKNSDREMQSLASFDELTGLMNRLSFVNLLESAGRRLDGSSAPPVAIGLLDVDRFKEVNEILGYAVGDRLLKEIGARLLSSVRKGDCVAREGDDKPLTVARRGGDEFLILLSDIGEAHDAALAGRRILDALRVPFRIEGQEVYLSASLGITFATEASASTEELLRQAEIAMYSAKELGRNTIQFFEETMDRSVVERFDIENRLRRAIGRNELELHYQPLVRPGSREVVGVEALVRWRHPERGLLSADAFVPVAEETGLIVGIGRWVLRTACRQLQTWRRSGLSPLRLSVNLSPREVRAPGFVASLAKILEETETEPSQLELELTERGVMNDGRTLEVLLRLKEIGVRLAVDDFGTGNTTFQYLKSFPLDTIKIDKSFTEGIAENPRDAAITKALLAMAHRLDLNVVAEGVETEEQLRFLSENECDQVQGYLFGRPIPAAELTHELSRFGNAAIA
jgi:diguanylate cyclase (GGDEF)-like protein